MERESFESAGVAQVLNEQFISIKVDREERPDVDRVYMTFVQATTGSGGWPMSVWLTPDLQPFYGGTYFPPTSQWGRPAFVDVLKEIDRAWRDDRLNVMKSATEIVARLERWRWARTIGGRRSQARWQRRFNSSRRPSTPGAAALATRRSFRGRASCCSCCASTSGRATMCPGDGGADAAVDGARRHARPHRRRLSPLFGGRQLARAALREDALRPGAAGARVSRGRAGQRRSVLRADRRRHAAVRAARHDRRSAAASIRRKTPTASPDEQLSRRPQRRTRWKARSTSGGRTRSARPWRRRAGVRRRATACCPTATRRSIRSRSS